MVRHRETQRIELQVLEEHFLDETRFKISSLFSLYHVHDKVRREILSLVANLTTITRENIKLIEEYAAQQGSQGLSTRSRLPRRNRVQSQSRD